MKILIKNGRVVDPTQKLNKKYQVYIDNGIIKKLGSKLPRLPKSVKVIDAKGCVVTPGLIDVHTHLRDPGYEDKEDIFSGTRAAVKGGFTTIMCMPNTDPVTDNVSGVNYVIEKAKKASCKVIPVGAITKGLEGKYLAEIGRMRQAGIKAISDDGFCPQDSNIIRNAMEYIRMFDLVLIEHAEDTRLSMDGQINEGFMSTKLGLAGIPDISESVIVSRDIQLAEYFNVPVHVAHVSSKKSLMLIKAAKKKGLPVTCEVTPHHLLFNENDLEDFNTNLKMKPPLRSEADRKALVKGFVDGTIDILASDHAPHRIDEKEREFSLAPFGVVGLETALSAMIQNFINNKKLNWSQLVTRMSVRPAEIFGLEGGTLKPGAPADVTIIHPPCRWEVSTETLVGKSKNSPFLGQELRGCVMNTIVDGNIEYGRK